MASDTVFERLAKLEREQKDAKASNYVKVVRKMIDDAILERIYPVGSIITRYDDGDPSEIIGGTWERYAEGRMVLGVGGDFNEVGSTGGNKSITLTEQQLPSHRHSGTTESTGGQDISLRGYGATLGSGNLGWRFGSGGSSSATGIASLPSHSHSFTTNSTGSGASINIMPPYVTAYLWRRVE